MKKVYILICMVVLLVSCKKDNKTNIPSPEYGYLDVMAVEPTAWSGPDYNEYLKVYYTEEDSQIDKFFIDRWIPQTNLEKPIALKPGNYWFKVYMYNPEKTQKISGSGKFEIIANQLTTIKPILY